MPNNIIRQTDKFGMIQITDWDIPKSYIYPVGRKLTYIDWLCEEKDRMLKADPTRILEIRTKTATRKDFNNEPIIVDVIALFGNDLSKLK